MVSGLGDGQNADPQSMDYPNGLPRRTTPAVLVIKKKNQVVPISNARQPNPWLWSS